MPCDSPASPRTSRLGLLLLWPQAHGTSGGRADRGTVQLGPGLGDAVMPPGSDQGNQSRGRQRVNPEVPVGAAAPAASAALLQEQPPVVVVVSRPPVPAGGRRAAAIGIQDAEPQLAAVALGARPRPLEDIGMPRPAGLILAAQPDMDGELKPIRVSADTAYRNSHLVSADQHRLAWDRTRDHRLRTHPGRPAPPDRIRWWWRLRDRIKKAHANRLTPAQFSASPLFQQIERDGAIWRRPAVCS